MKPMACAFWLLFTAVPALAAEVDWPAVAATDVVEVLTSDEGGEPRETKVWIVALGDRGYVRTNDSRWLANIRRGSPIALRADGDEIAVAAREVDDQELRGRVEAAFREKYGFLQRVMSAFRIREPTVIELSAR